MLYYVQYLYLLKKQAKCYYVKDTEIHSKNSSNLGVKHRPVYVLESA